MGFPLILLTCDALSLPSLKLLALLQSLTSSQFERQKEITAKTPHFNFYPLFAVDVLPSPISK